MFTHHGMGHDAWITIDGGCAMRSESHGGEAYLCLGPRSGSLTIVAGAEALHALIGIASEALAAITPGGAVADAAPARNAKC